MHYSGIQQRGKRGKETRIERERERERERDETWKERGRVDRRVGKKRGGKAAVYGRQHE